VEVAEKINLKKIINEIGKFKTMRNTMAHGLDATDNYISSNPVLKIEIVGRSGKTVVKEITPQSHKETLESGDRLLLQIKEARKEINLFLK